MPAIREAVLDDSEALNLLSAHLGYTETTVEIAHERLKKLLESNSDWVWVYEETGKILGWIHFFTAYRVASAMFNEIGGLVVSPGARRLGIGRKLVELVAIESAKQNLTLRVRCDERRLDADLFYDNIGFSKAKSQHVYNM